jgi:hypothetical protein
LTALDTASVYKAGQESVRIEDDVHAVLNDPSGTTIYGVSRSPRRGCYPHLDLQSRGQHEAPFRECPPLLGLDDSQPAEFGYPRPVLELFSLYGREQYNIHVGIHPRVVLRP